MRHLFDIRYRGLELNDSSLATVTSKDLSWYFPGGAGCDLKVYVVAQVAIEGGFGGAGCNRRVYLVVLGEGFNLRVYLVVPGEGVSPVGRGRAPPHGYGAH